jgi:uncharacterized protein (DUF58 family)
VSRDVYVFPLVPRRPVAGLPFGAMRSGRRGAGADLAGSRPYRPGDDVRRIDWRASARLSSARSAEEFVVREHFAEEAACVVVLVDRSPTMALYPDGFPWLSKPAALVTSGSMIADSALRARCLVGYLDDADEAHPLPEKRAESPFWRAPAGELEAWRLLERYLPYAGFHAREGTVDRLLQALSAPERAPAAGTFVFVLSDFLTVPSSSTWRRALLRGWDVVPVVIQDPTWERSFPRVSGAVLPVVDPRSGRASLVRLRRGEAEERRLANEARLAKLRAQFAALGLTPIDIAANEPETVLDAFLAWSDARRHGARLAR